MESIREEIFLAIINKIKGITTDAAYHNTVKQVYDPPVAFDKMAEFPSVNIIEGNEICTIESTTHGNGGLLSNYFDVEFDCVFSSVNNPRKTRSRMLSDVQKMFGINYHLGIDVVSNCQYKSSTPWGEQSGLPMFGITIAYRIWYRQMINNPLVNT